MVMLLVALALLTQTSAAQAELSIGDVSAAHGDEVTIPIMIHDATGVAAVGLNLRYYPDVVNVTDAEQGDLTDYFGFDSSNAANGWVTINTYVMVRDLTGDLIVANVTLEAVGSPGDSSPLNLEIISLVDQYGNEPPGTINNGIFKIPSDGSGNGGSGGSSGGGGGSSSEEYANIVLRETKCVYVSKDKLISYEFEKPMNDIVYVNFTAITIAGDVCTMVEMLKSASTSVKTDPPDNVYKNINIWAGLSGYATERNIRDASITFRVDQRWINGIDPSTITLDVYHTDSWHPLKTTMIGEDDSYAYFTAGTGYFGMFAITARDAQTGAPTDQPVPEPADQPSEQVAPSELPAEETSRSIPGFNASFGLIGLVIACLLRRR